MDRDTIMMENTTTIVKTELLDTNNLSDDEIMLRLKKTCNADPSKIWKDNKSV